MNKLHQKYIVFSQILFAEGMNNLKMFLYLYCTYFYISFDYFFSVPLTDQYIKSATKR